MNRTLFAADCLDILNDSAIIPDASVDLIYLDPPFNSNSKYNLPFKGKDKNHKPVEAFVDIWKWSDQDAEALDDLRRNPKTRPLATIIKFAQDVELMSGKQRKGTSLASYLLNMAVRLRAMRRVLKETGSIYLHCDPTASHYLKLLMDAIYGNSAFRSEIIWRRHAHSHSLGAKQWPAIHDVLLMYTKGKKWSWNTQHKDYTADYIRKSFRYSDENGPYQAYPITGARPGGQEAYEAWRGRTPSTSRAWALPRYSLLPNWINLPSEEEWSKLSIHSKLDCLDDAGLIHWPRKKGGQPALKRYQRDAPGKIIEDIWTEIGVRVGAKENLGYPTQKPLALLERIIRASSNEGDTVLDPFCGCGTTVHAAESLGRKWLGIDISKFSAGLIRDRILHNFKYLNADDLAMRGTPDSVAEARALARQDPFEFEKWVCGYIGAEGMFREPGQRGADGGVDGVLKFFPVREGQKVKPEYAIVQVKGGHVSADSVKALHETVRRYEATAGVMVCFADQLGTVENQRARATFKDAWGSYPVIQGFSVESLLSDGQLDLPLYGYKRRGAMLGL